MSQQTNPQETDQFQTQQYETAPIQLVSQPYLLKIQIASENRELFRILPNGDVEAPDLESASEAGRVFIESLRIEGKTYVERIQELENEVQTLKQKIHEMRQGDQIF